MLRCADGTILHDETCLSKSPLSEVSRVRPQYPPSLLLITKSGRRRRFICTAARRPSAQRLGRHTTASRNPDDVSKPSASMSVEGVSKSVIARVQKLAGIPSPDGWS